MVPGSVLFLIRRVAFLPECLDKYQTVVSMSYYCKIRPYKNLSESSCYSFQSFHKINSEKKAHSEEGACEARDRARTI